MNVLDLFSGIGGFSLGLERAGMRTVAFCEVEPYCRAVLAKHWPSVPLYADVRELTADRLRADGISVDAICGGFPCQDISLAGPGAGLDGARSGLWFEYRRLVKELEPCVVIIENSPALRTRGADRIISGLEDLGYTCEAFVVGAIHVGAPHRRHRAWIVAYSDSAILRYQSGRRGRQGRTGAAVARDNGPPGTLADTNGEGELQQEGPFSAIGRWLGHGGESLADPNGAGLEIVLNGQPGQRASAVRAHAWSSEPDVGRVAYGVPARAHRIKALGNSVVPQITEAIGRAIMRTIA